MWVGETQKERELLAPTVAMQGMRLLQGGTGVNKKFDMLEKMYTNPIISSFPPLPHVTHARAVASLMVNVLKSLYFYFRLLFHYF